MTRTAKGTVLLTVHIAATVGLLGADLALVALGVAGARGADPRTVYPAAHLLGSSLAAPLAVLSLTTGLLLAALTSWGLLRYWWVTIKLALTVVLTSLLLVVLVPALTRVADLATGQTPQLITDAQRLRLAVAPAAAALMLALSLGLATSKPRWNVGRLPAFSRRRR
jgi:hypothetical protein